MSYLFFSTADCQQDEIWEYTCNRWGEKQAEEYIRGLHHAIEDAVEKPYLWRKLKQLEIKEVFYIRYRSHFIFFKILSSKQLGILCLLHEHMQLPEELLSAIDDDKTHLVMEEETEY